MTKETFANVTLLFILAALVFGLYMIISNHEVTPDARAQIREENRVKECEIKGNEKAWQKECNKYYYKGNEDLE